MKSRRGVELQQVRQLTKFGRQLDRTLEYVGTDSVVIYPLSDAVIPHVGAIYIILGLARKRRPYTWELGTRQSKTFLRGKKILVVGQTLFEDGLSDVAEDFTKLRNEKGYEFIDVRYLAVDAPSELHELSEFLRGQPEDFLNERTIEIVRKYDPDIIFGNQPHISALAMRLPKEVDISTIPSPDIDLDYMECKKVLVINDDPHDHEAPRDVIDRFEGCIINLGDFRYGVGNPLRMFTFDELKKEYEPPTETPEP